MYATFLCWCAESVVGLTAVAPRTVAFVRPYRVKTFGTVATDLFSFHALVNVDARSILGGFEALRACTVTNPSGNSNTFGSVRTRAVVVATRQNAVTISEFIRWLAATIGTVTLETFQKRISVEARWALTVIASG